MLMTKTLFCFLGYYIYSCSYSFSFWYDFDKAMHFLTISDTMKIRANKVYYLILTCGYNSYFFYLICFYFILYKLSLPIHKVMTLRALLSDANYYNLVICWCQKSNN